MYVDEHVNIRPLILGGGQQKGMRSGTDNVPGIAGLGEAARAAYEDFPEKQAYLYELKAHFMEGLAALPDVVLNSLPGEEGRPILSAPASGACAARCFSTRWRKRGSMCPPVSACSSNKKLPVSTVLKEIGLEKELLDATLRFSFSTFTTREELITAWMP